MNMTYERFLHEFIKKVNTFYSSKDMCEFVCEEVLKMTNAALCRIYLPDNENKSLSVKKIYYSSDEGMTDFLKDTADNIFQLGKDLFSNNYEPEEMLDYFKNLSKDNVVMEPLIVNGSLCGYFAVFGNQRDFYIKHSYLIETITEVVNSRLENLMLRDELERHNKEKIQFLASISHEYKTPLNSIIGFSDILKANITDDKNYKYIDNISKSSRFLLSLIQDILDMARSEFAAIELVRENFRPKEIIEDIAYGFQETVNSKNLHLSYTIMDVEINADIKRFKQLIYNLISNAVKFNKDNGKITIVSYIDEKNDFVFEIKDTGDGIRKKDCDKIFEFFSQVNKNSLKRRQGSGVGLALCKKIVEAHGGDITFKSRLNFGSTFRFTIPQKQSALH